MNDKKNKSEASTIVWTPFQRQSVIDFLKQYTAQLEEVKGDPEKAYGLPGIQKGVLHLADMVLPSGVSYKASSGPNGSIYDGVHVVVSDEGLNEIERKRSGEARD